MNGFFFRKEFKKPNFINGYSYTFNVFSSTDTLFLEKEINRMGRKEPDMVHNSWAHTYKVFVILRISYIDNDVYIFGGFYAPCMP